MAKYRCAIDCQNANTLLIFVFLMAGSIFSQNVIKELGSYKMVQDSAVTKYCATYNIDEIRQKSLATQPKRSSFILSVYHSGEEPLVQFVRHQDPKQFIREGWWIFLKLTIIPLIGSLISVCFVPGVTIWMIWSCCKKVNNTEDKFEKRRDYFKLFVNCMVIFLMLTLLAIGILWTLQVVGVIRSIGPMSCTASLAFSEVLNGALKPTFFPGISGYKFLANHLASGINKTLNDSSKFTDYSTKTNQILSYDMPALNTSIVNSFKDYLTVVKQSKVVNFDRPDDLSAIVSLNITASMIDMVNQAIGNDHIVISTLADRLHTSAALLAKSFNDSNQRTALVNLSHSFANQTTNIEDQMKKQIAKIVTSFDYNDNRTYAFVVLMTFSISVTVILSLYSMFGFVNIVLKSFNWLVYISKSIMLCTAVLGCLMSAIAVVLVMLSGILVNSCEIFDRSLTDSSLMKQLQVSNQVKLVFDTCIYANSSGEFLNIMNETNKQSSTHLNLSFQLLKGFTNSSQIDATTKKSSDSIAVGLFDGYLRDDILSFKSIDRYASTASYTDIQSAIIKLNNDISNKVKDVFAMHKDRCMTLSKYSPPESMNYAGDLCLLLPNVTENISNRNWYSTLTADEKKRVDNMKIAQQNYSATVKDVSDRFSQGTTTPAFRTRDLFSKYQSSMASYADIRSFFNEAARFFESDPVNSSASVLFNCKIVRNQLQYVRSAICGDFADTFAMQSFWLGILGLCTALLGVCMCIQLRLIDRDKNKLPSHMKTDTKPSVELNELML